MDDPGDTLSTIVDDEPREHRSRRIRAAVLALLFAIVLAGLAGELGVRSAHATSRGPDGLSLDVEYPAVARPGLSAPLSIEIHRPGGFDEPIEVSVPTSYLEAFDENGFDPDPVQSTVDGKRTRWVYDPPEGDVLVVWFDHRLEPGVQWRHDGDVKVTAGSTSAHVDFTTWVLP